MRKILLSVLVIISACAGGACYQLPVRCENDNRTCISLAGLLNKSDAEISNFKICDRRQISPKYEAVILYSDTIDRFGLFIVDKNTQVHYMTVTLLESYRVHDYYYEITDSATDYINLRSAGDMYDDGPLRFRCFFNLDTKQVARCSVYNDISLDKIFRYGDELFFSGDISPSSAVICRLALTPKEGKHDYEIFTEADGIPLNTIFSIEEKYGELRFGAKNQTYVYGKDKKFAAKKFISKAAKNNYENARKYENMFTPPQADLELLKKYRPQMIQPNIEPDYKFENKTGPAIQLGDKVWFGVDFYDGEGVTAVGGYGIYDTSSQTFDMHYEPEIVDWAASAILVDSDKICLGLYRQPEASPGPGGLFCEYFKTKTKKIFKIPHIINSIAQYGDTLVLATANGIYLIKNDKITAATFSVNEQGKFQLDFKDISQ